MPSEWREQYPGDFHKDHVPMILSEVRVDVTPAMLAQAFAAMSDEDQAQFFIDVAAVAETWGPGNFPQWFAVGRHLAKCECSNEQARQLVEDIAGGIAAGRREVRSCVR